MLLEETVMIERTAKTGRRGRSVNMKRTLGDEERRMTEARWIWVVEIRRNDATEMRIFHHHLGTCLLHLEMDHLEK